MADVCKIKTDSGTYDVRDERIDELLQSTLTIKAGSYIGGTWSVTGGDENYSGTIDADEIEIGLKAHQTTYTVTITFEGEELVETVTTGIYYNHYEVDFAPPTDLEHLTWEEISEISQAGNASAYWSVGDVKGVDLDTYINSSHPIQGTYYVFILGFDHNADIEGANTVHLQFGKTEDGTDICFADAAMNSSNINTGGWASCNMRTSVCPTFLEALPDDLQAVVRKITKYTDNTGNGSSGASNITSTEDELFLLSEFEVFASTDYSNTYEANYQKQYDYYAAGNSKVKEYHNSTNSGIWWGRSPIRTLSIGFVGTNHNGYSETYYATVANGFAPAFVV